MLILHRMAQLGVMTQKRPEIWVSYPRPREVSDDLFGVQLQIGNQILNEVIATTDVDESSSVRLAIGDQKLYEVVATSYALDESQVSLSIGNQRLIEVIRTNEHTEYLVGVSLDIGDQKLYSNAVFATMSDEDNAAISLSIGDQKLYEEQ